MEELELASIVMALRLKVRYDSGVNDAGKEVIKNYILIVKSNQLLNVCERQTRIIGNSAVMKT